MRTRLFTSSLVVCLLASLSALSQNRGTLTGVVLDQVGAVLPGVAVTIDGPERRKGITNEKGEFSFVGLMPGEYQIRLELPGFQTLVSTARLNAGSSRKLTLQMSVATLQESVAGQRGAGPGC